MVKTNLSFAVAMVLGTAALASAQIEIVPIRGHMYLLAGAGANITLSVGPDGVFMVDGGSPQMTDKVIAAVKLPVDHRSGPGRAATAHLSASQADPLPGEYHDLSRSHRRECERSRKRARLSPAAMSAQADLNSGFANDDAAILSTEKAMLRS